jgi:hypothetical protein
VQPPIALNTRRWRGSQKRIWRASSRAPGPAASMRATSRSRSQVCRVTSAVTRVVAKPAPSTATLASGSEQRL